MDASKMTCSNSFLLLQLLTGIDLGERSIFLYHLFLFLPGKGKRCQSLEGTAWCNSFNDAISPSDIIVGGFPINEFPDLGGA
jgi:hypothetical protein